MYGCFRTILSCNALNLIVLQHCCCCTKCMQSPGTLFICTSDFNTVFYFSLENLIITSHCLKAGYYVVPAKPKRVQRFQKPPFRAPKVIPRSESIKSLVQTSRSCTDSLRLSLVLLTREGLLSPNTIYYATARVSWTRKNLSEVFS